MPLVDLAHQRQGGRRDRLGDGIHRRPRDRQDLALLHHRQRVLPVNHRFALASWVRPSAPAKKPFSIANWPILACRSLTIGPHTALRSATVTNRSVARSCNYVFHCTIWFG